MESEARPTKKRRLSHDAHAESDAVAAPLTSTEVPDIKTRSLENDADSTASHANGANLEDHIESLPHDPSGQLLAKSEKSKNDSAGSDPDAAHGKTASEPSGSSILEGVVRRELPPPNEVAPLVNTNLEDGVEQPMSKNQQKKLRKKLEWEAKREERKVIRKEKITAKRERKKEERKQRAADQEAQPGASAKVRLPKKQHVQLPVTIVIDCDFDELMRDKEIISLAAQITRSYSDNKNSTYRAHLTICSFHGKLRDRFDNILTHYEGWRGVQFLDCDFVEASAQAKDWMLDEDKGGSLVGTFAGLNPEQDQEIQSKLQEQGEVVYLTSEAEDTLTELKPYSTYIIGGLVDKNREKGLCYRRATQRNVKTARLPIGEFMDLQSRKVLATNHVNEIMLKWLECGDWGEAFMKAIPKRKGGKLKDGNVNEDEVNGQYTRESTAHHFEDSSMDDDELDNGDGGVAIDDNVE